MVVPRAPVRVMYVGRLATTGKVFDATKGKPFSFRLGRGEVREKQQQHKKCEVTICLLLWNLEPKK